MNPETSPKLDLRRCLTLHQPWAWLLTHGHKDVENRTWKQNFRGRLFIHAGAKFDADGYDWVKSTFPEIQLPAPNEFKHGGIVGSVFITDIVTASPSKWAQPDQYHWLCTEATVLPFEPCRGIQKIWTAGARRRVMELPEGFVIKSSRVAHPSDDEHSPLAHYRANLYRNGVLIWQSAIRHTGALVRDDAMKEAHRLHALPAPPAALTEETCNCNTHEA